MKQTILIARIFSTVFRPSYYPTVGTFVLLSFTYLSLFPWGFKLWILGLVYGFTFCLPTLGIYTHWASTSIEGFMAGALLNYAYAINEPYPTSSASVAISA